MTPSHTDPSFLPSGGARSSKIFASSVQPPRCSTVSEIATERVGVAVIRENGWNTDEIEKWKCPALLGENNKKELL